LVRFS